LIRLARVRPRNTNRYAMKGYVARHISTPDT
jgi:hypothetical protein